MTKILPGYRPFTLPDSRAQKLDTGDLKSTKSFGQIFKDLISDTNKLQSDAARIAEKFALGEIADVHEVMIAAEKAGVAFELVMEIRNKLVEAYQEFMRMQV
ncbi:MAG: flagellar hook-basal body complex protein FliE [Candidatus Zixiibacteriota bacterium]|nr:MAG: flagellar hook-basal body complex protein FliE [candidate division Zixibacteria bacterium]